MFFLNCSINLVKYIAVRLCLHYFNNNRKATEKSKQLDNVINRLNVNYICTDVQKYFGQFYKVEKI